MDVSKIRSSVEPVAANKSQTMSRLILQQAIESAQQNQQPESTKARAERANGKSLSLQPHLGQNIDIYV